MRLVHDFRFARTPRASVLELPYGGSTTALILVLPHPGQELAALVQEEDIDAWTRGLTERLVDVALPRFRIACGREWSPALRGLGVERAFDADRAELSRMSGEPFYVGAVLQNAWIAVDETGTEATAATAVTVAPGAPAVQPEPLEFHVDRPFLFFIRHRATGMVLFIGQVEDPTT
jgi:serpin B